MARKKKSTSDSRTVLNEIKKDQDRNALRTALQPTFEGTTYTVPIAAFIDFVNITESVDAAQG